MSYESDKTIEQIPTTYIWAWSDGEGNYINKASSLRQIIEEILEYYYCDEENITVNEGEDKFSISIQSDDQHDQYEIDIEIDSVREFLNDLAKIVDRPDTFDIRLESD